MHASPRQHFPQAFFTVPPFEVICGTKAWQLPLQGIMDDDQEGSVVGFMQGNCDD